MLVLTRKMHEKIQIGENVTVTILRVKGRAVRIGIEAPKGVRVMRAEIPANEFGDDEATANVEASRPAVAEAATSMADDDEHPEILEPSREVNKETGRMPSDPPLSLHIARRFRIIGATASVNAAVRAAAVAAS